MNARIHSTCIQIIGNVADEQVILFLAISSSDNLQLEIGLVSLLIAGLTSTFQNPQSLFHHG